MKTRIVTHLIKCAKKRSKIKLKRSIIGKNSELFWKLSRKSHRNFIGITTFFPSKMWHFFFNFPIFEIFHTKIE